MPGPMGRPGGKMETEKPKNFKETTKKLINGYFLLDGFISSRTILSSNFFLDVACLLLDALAENLAIKSCNSLIFSSFFLLESFICF